MSSALKCWHAASPPRLILRVFLYRVEVGCLSALGILTIHLLRLPPQQVEGLVVRCLERSAGHPLWDQVGEIAVVARCYHQCHC
jgi:hypothetical protein